MTPWAQRLGFAPQSPTVFREMQRRCLITSIGGVSITWDWPPNSKDKEMHFLINIIFVLWMSPTMQTFQLERQFSKDLWAYHTAKLPRAGAFHCCVILTGQGALEIFTAKPLLAGPAHSRPPTKNSSPLSDAVRSTLSTFFPWRKRLDLHS